MVQQVSIAVERKLVRLTKLKLDCAELKLDYEKLKKLTLHKTNTGLLNFKARL